MKMKLLSILFLMASLLACSKFEMPSQVQAVESDKSSLLRAKETISKAFEVLKEDVSEDYILTYFSSLETGTLRTSGLPLKGIDRFDLYLHEHGLNMETLVELISQDPSKIEDIVRDTSTVEFFNAYIKVLYSSEFEVEVANILRNIHLNSVEKGVLVLLAAEMNHQELRSLSSCAKRYAKLASIAAKAAAISLIDVEAGVEYATRELKRMNESGEYEC